MEDFSIPGKQSNNLSDLLTNFSFSWQAHGLLNIADPNPQSGTNQPGCMSRVYNGKFCDQCCSVLPIATRNILDNAHDQAPDKCLCAC